jgi:hypothetical protein
MAIYALKEYLQEYSWGILAFSGIALLVVGLMFMQSFGSPLSMIGFFLGIILVTFGFFARIGLFSSKLGSLDGLGTILICVSVVFLSLSFAVIEFSAVAGYESIPIFSRSGKFIGMEQEPIIYRPYAWLSLTSIGIGLPIFLAGLIVKAYSARR